MSADEEGPVGPDLAAGAPSGDIAEGQMLAGHVGDDAVLVARVGGELFAIGAHCSHYGGPLAEGLVRDGCVTCPWHWYSYELATGRCRTAVGYELRRYEVVLEGGLPHAVIPAAEPARSWSEILRSHARSGGAGS